MSDGREMAERILALDAAATPGPWTPTLRWNGWNDHWHTGEVIGPGNRVVCNPVVDGAFDSQLLADPMAHPDTGLICDYRMDAPALARAYLELLAQVDEMREYVQHDAGCSAPFGEDVYPCKCGLARLRAGWTV